MTCALTDLQHYQWSWKQHTALPQLFEWLRLAHSSCRYAGVDSEKPAFP